MKIVSKKKGGVCINGKTGLMLNYCRPNTYKRSLNISAIDPTSLKIFLILRKMLQLTEGLHEKPDMNTYGEISMKIFYSYS